MPDPYAKENYRHGAAFSTEMTSFSQMFAMSMSAEDR